MPVLDIHVPEGKILWGHIFLIVCTLFYLAWWVVAFKPNSSAGMGKMVTLLAMASVAGIAGTILEIVGIRGVNDKKMLLPGSGILIGGVIAYVFLFFVTYLIFKRQVTTELFLIVGWAVLEMCAVNALYGLGQFQLTAAIVFAVVIAAAALISLICYIFYYKLEQNAGYIDGMIPLILAAVVMIAVTIKTAA